jgi:hypothetical protein
MKKIFTKKIIFSLLGVVFSINAFAQNMEKLLIEPETNCGIVIPEQCNPKDIRIIVNSSIQNLHFESNMLPDSAFIVIYYEQANQYIICHPREKFILTVSGTNLQSGDIEVFDIEMAQICYRISANITRGTVNINTTPSNAIVIFRDLGDQSFSTDNPITLSSGNYKVNIIKPQYKNVDTVIVIPSNAERTYKIDLIPLFSRIRLELNTADKSPFLKSPVIWIDSVKIELDALVTGGKKPNVFREGVQFLQFYEGNIIPLNEGTYSIKIEADTYNPFKTSIVARNGQIVNLGVSLEPKYGDITFIDKQLAEGAIIYIDNQNVGGKVPLARVKTRIGSHKLRFEKPGVRTLQEEFTVVVYENLNTDFEVSMILAKKITFDIEPANSEIFVDSLRIGFSPYSTLVNAGKHMIVIRKNGYAGVKITKVINEQSPDEEIIKLKLSPIFPFIVNSEEEGLPVKMKGIQDLENIEIDSTLKTPATFQLPYGKYKISLTKENKVVYKSSINHSPDILKRGKFPVYSRSSFQVLTGSFENKNNFEGSFGRVYLYPGFGLSTSILNIDYRLTSVNIDSSSYSINYSFKTIAPYIFLLNWDWRIGGSVLRQVDFNLLGRAKYTPGLKTISLKIPGYSDVEMQSYFYGFEISTRFSYINFNIRYGRQMNIGKVHYWNLTNKEFTKDNFMIDESRNVGTIGITLGGRVNKSNNILRLWHRPLFDLLSGRSGTKNRPNNTVK